MTTLTGLDTVSRNKVGSFGSVAVRKDEKTPVYWSPVTGGVLIVVGAVLVMAGSKKESSE